MPPGFPPFERCATCLKPATKVCKCGVTWFCSRQCQETLFPSHKAACRLWRRLDDGKLDGAVDSVRTFGDAEPGSRCWICLEAGGVIWSGCGCRGDAAAIHVECAVKLALSRPLDVECHAHCPTCKKLYAPHLAARIQLAIFRAATRHAVARASSACFVGILTQSDSAAGHSLLRKVAELATALEGAASPFAVRANLRLVPALLERESPQAVDEALSRLREIDAVVPHGDALHVSFGLCRALFMKALFLFDDQDDDAAHALLDEAIACGRAGTSAAATDFEHIQRGFELVLLHSTRAAALFAKGQREAAIAMHRDNACVPARRNFGDKHPITRQLACAHVFFRTVPPFARPSSRWLQHLDKGLLKPEDVAKALADTLPFAASR